MEVFVELNRSDVSRLKLAVNQSELDEPLKRELTATLDKMMFMLQFTTILKVG